MKQPKSKSTQPGYPSKCPTLYVALSPHERPPGRRTRTYSINLVWNKESRVIYHDSSENHPSSSLSLSPAPFFGGGDLTTDEGDDGRELFTVGKIESASE